MSSSTKSNGFDFFGSRNPDQSKSLWKLNDISEKSENEGMDIGYEVKSQKPIYLKEISVFM